MSLISHLLFNATYLPKTGSCANKQISLHDTDFRLSVHYAFPSSVIAMMLWNWFLEDFTEIDEKQNALEPLPSHFAILTNSSSFFCHEKCCIAKKKKEKE